MSLGFHKKISSPSLLYLILILFHDYVLTCLLFLIILGLNSGTILRTKLRKISLYNISILVYCRSILQQKLVILGFQLGWWSFCSSILWCSSAVFTSSLHIHISHGDCVWTVMLERAIMPTTLFRGLLVLGSCSVLAANPFANLKPFLIHANAHSTFFFCSLVSRPYAGWLGCARDECVFD
jgi:hypothetical protein